MVFQQEFLKKVNLKHEIFLGCKELICRNPVISMHLKAEWETVWTLISWLHRSQLIWIYTIFKAGYSKICLKLPLKRTPKLVFNTNYRLMQVKSIAECSPWSILQYFRPSLSYHFPLRHLFCLFLSGRLRQVFLYIEVCFGKGSLIKQNKKKELLYILQMYPYSPINIP